MKMKKLLAGVLSAAMVATMIPASMAFSGVSAAPEDSLVKSYDLTTEEGRSGWVANVRTTENVTNPLSEPSVGDSGVTFTGGWAGNADSNGSQSYTITNPLQGNATNGFSVVVTVTVSNNGFRNAYESMFNFNGSDTASQAFFNVSGNGGGLHLNEWGIFWDYTAGSTVDLTSESQFVLTVTSDDTITLYKNGELVNVYTVSSYTGNNVVNAVNNMSNFSLGAAPETFGQAGMTFSAVSFYSDALTRAEVVELYDSSYDSSEEDILSGMTEAYSFNNTLDSAIGGEAATLTGSTINSEVTATNATYTTDGAVSINPTLGYGLKVAEINTNTFTVSFDVSYNASTVNAAGIFIENNVASGSEQYSSVGQGWQSSLTAMVWSHNQSSTENYWYDVVGKSMPQGEYTTLTAVFNNGFVILYQDGVAVAGGSAPTSFVNGARIYIGANAWNSLINASVKNFYLYDRALTANEVSALNDADDTALMEKAYAQSIADDLNVTMLGRQLGTTSKNQNGIRFVAGIDKSVVDNSAVTRLGWMFESGTTVTASAKTATLVNVTDASVFGSDEDMYAYTLVVTTGDDTTTSTAVLPCVEVNGYWFAYDGISGGYNAIDSADVIASVDANAAFADAGV